MWSYWLNLPNMWAVVIATLILSVFHIGLGIISIGVGLFASIQAEVWMAHSVSPIWSGAFVSQWLICLCVFQFCMFQDFTDMRPIRDFCSIAHLYGHDLPLLKVLKVGIVLSCKGVRMITVQVTEDERRGTKTWQQKVIHWWAKFQRDQTPRKHAMNSWFTHVKCSICTEMNVDFLLGDFCIMRKSV